MIDDVWTPAVSAAFDKLLDPPEPIQHCDCLPCDICGGQYDPRGRCEHGCDDEVCEHKFCLNCGGVLPANRIEYEIHEECELPKEKDE